MHRAPALFLVVTIVALTSAQLGRVVSDDPPETLPGAVEVIDAARYGSIQAAIDAAPRAGGIVRLPPGKFEISQPLRIRSDQLCLEGSGTGTHLHNTNTDGLPALIVAHPDHDQAGNDRKHELWGVRLANFRLTGSAKSGAGIAAYNINEIHLDAVTVSYHGGDGVLLSYCYEDPRVCQCVLTYNKAVGLNLRGCHDIVVAANQFEENQDALHCTDGFNLCLTGNCVDDHLGRGVLIEATYGSVISGNMIEECAAAAVTLDRDCYGIAISANVIAHNGAGIDLRDAHGCTVSANTLTIMKTDALRIGPKSGRIAVSGNSISSSYIGEGRDRRAEADRTTAGLVLESTTGILVNGNVLSGVDEQAIRIVGAPPTSSAISNNLLIDTDPGVPTVSPPGAAQDSNYAD